MRQFGMFLIAGCFSCLFLHSQTYPPAAGEPGSTAIHFSDNLFVSWASSVEVERGYINIADPEFTIGGSNKVSYGEPEDAVGIPDDRVVSLGDGGTAIAQFENPVENGPGFDFAVFENGFNNTYLELAFVEVSSNGIDFFRFPSHSLTQTSTQTGSFGDTDPADIHNLAGKYRSMFGTPFDLDDLEDHPLLDKNRITHIKIIDVVGSIDPEYASYDSFGNIINDPFPTPFESGGFDLDGIGVINQKLNKADFSKPDLRIYPNPASDYFQISGEKLQFGLIVYTVNGEEVLSVKNAATAEKINISNLNPGTYLVLIAAEKFSNLFKLIIK